MANNCWYALRIVSPNKESIDRLLSIMQYKDKDYYIYRCFDAGYDDEPEQGADSLWTAIIVGDVAWSLNMWCKGFTTEEERNTYVNHNGAQYCSLNDICKAFGIGIEVWGAEPDIGFQQHFYINKYGETCIDEEVEWITDENSLDPRIGGFGKRYETWLDNSFYEVEATETLKN